MIETHFANLMSYWYFLEDAKDFIGKIFLSKNNIRCSKGSSFLKKMILEQSKVNL